jgi:hypothetical protein
MAPAGDAVESVAQLILVLFVSFVAEHHERRQEFFSGRAVCRDVARELPQQFRRVAVWPGERFANSADDVSAVRLLTPTGPANSGRSQSGFLDASAPSRRLPLVHNRSTLRGPRGSHPRRITTRLRAVGPLCIEDSSMRPASARRDLTGRSRCSVVVVELPARMR